MFKSKSTSWGNSSETEDCLAMSNNCTMHNQACATKYMSLCMKGTSE